MFIFFSGNVKKKKKSSVVWCFKTSVLLEIFHPWVKKRAHLFGDLEHSLTSSTVTVGASVVT